MAAGDKFLYGVSAKVLLACLDDPEAIRYRQRVLADCLAQPGVIRQMYSVATAALEDKRHIWGGYGGTYQNPSSNLSGAVSIVEAFVARLRQLRQIADDHAGEFRSDGLRRLFTTLQRDLDDEYFGEISYHLKQLRFRAGVLISAELGRDNSGIDLALRAPGDARPGWKERLGIGPRTSYSFTLAPRDEAGGADPVRPHQPGGQPRRQRGRPVRRPHPQLFHHAPGGAGLLRRLPQPRGPAGRQGGAGRGSRARAARRRSRSRAPTCAIPAWSCSHRAAVVGNDVQADGKSLVIITGANSGGKSTFLRSVGVAQLMMQCGLFVTAGSYRANVTRGIFTHFIREEDAGMTSGRLDEELRRMSAIADQIGP